MKKENIVNITTTDYILPKVIDTVLAANYGSLERSTYGFNVRMEEVRKFREFKKIGKEKEFKKLSDLRK